MVNIEGNSRGQLDKFHALGQVADLRARFITADIPRYCKSLLIDHNALDR